MQINIEDDTVVITILDSESNSSDKDAFLDLLISKWSDQATDRTYQSDQIQYRITRTLWNKLKFQKRFLWLTINL